ncbi:TetR/AcrR family transcriptional regulator [Streptomyces sp. NPDC050658]|uniref:TetR/AcrR family transcriptional regulator n=1 Tax=unclassified Streptomyces TaxID=2593676 RepID=UPI0034165AD4
MSVAPLRGGRPRQDQLLGATLDVLREKGYDRLTVDAVVARARASKATVYRRWPSKSALVVAAFASAVEGVATQRDTGSLRGDLLAALDGLLGEMERLGDVIAGLVGELRRNTELAEAMRAGYIDAQRQMVVDIFDRARARGELAAEADVEMLWQLAPSVISFRVLLAGEPVDRAYVTRLVDEVVLPLARR